EMMDVDFRRHREFDARLTRPQAEVVVVEEAHAVTLVESADPVEDVAADKQTEAGGPVNPQGLAAELAPAPLGEAVEALEIGRAGPYSLRVRGVVRHWSH